MTTAMVLSGGASLGSVQVGMLLALEEEGIRPDLIAGTSVGAINGAWLASGQSARTLASIWHGLRRSDLFPMRPVVGLRGFPAIEAGATEVWVLAPGYSCGLSVPPAGAIAIALHAVNLLVQQRLVLETATRDYPVPVRLIPPPCPISVSPTDFSQTEELIERSRLTTRQWLANGRPLAMPLPRQGDVGV